MRRGVASSGLHRQDIFACESVELYSTHDDSAADVLLEAAHGASRCGARGHAAQPLGHVALGGLQAVAHLSLFTRQRQQRQHAKKTGAGTGRFLALQPARLH